MIFYSKNFTIIIFQSQKLGVKMNRNQEIYHRFMLRVDRYSHPYSFKKFWMDKIRHHKRKYFIVKTYNDLTDNVKKNNECCSVCFDDFCESSKVHQTSCGHYFCVSCIEKWTNKNNYTCPLCRGNL